MKELANRKLITFDGNLEAEDVKSCEECILGKNKKIPYGLGSTLQLGLLNMHTLIFGDHHQCKVWVEAGTFSQSLMISVERYGYM